MRLAAIAVAVLLAGVVSAQVVPFSQAAIESGITPRTTANEVEHIFGSDYIVGLVDFFPWAPLNAKIRGFARPPIKVVQKGSHITFSAPAGTTGDVALMITGMIPLRDAGEAVWLQGITLSFHPKP